MVVIRQISKGRYLAAALISLMIFLLGLSLGIYLSGTRVGYIEELANKQKLDYDSLQLQYNFIDLIKDEKNCVALNKALDLSVDNLENTRVKLELYSEDINMNGQKYNDLKREYMLAEIKYWMLTQKSAEICKRDAVYVLYFYKEGDECPDCETQSYILTYLKGIFKEKLMVFSIDASFDESEPLVKILKDVYNVDEYPTLVVNGKTYDGLIELNKLKREICYQYTNRVEGCIAS